RARDNARTPMQWNDEENGGFTTGTPWLKVNPNYKEINVKESLADEDSIFHYMQKLIRMRKENLIAVYGDFKEYEPDNRQLYIYERNYQDQKMFVVLNFSDQEASFTMPREWEKEEAKPLISNYPEKPLQSRTFAPWEAAVYLR